MVDLESQGTGFLDLDLVNNIFSPGNEASESFFLTIDGWKIKFLSGMADFQRRSVSFRECRFTELLQVPSN